MSDDRPLLIIRLGSHAEKEYVVKLASFLDGLIVGANLFESTPGATASLLLRIQAKKTRIYLDPMTYAFGKYVEPGTGRVRGDLDWIKSDQQRKEGGKKKTVRDFKRSYRALAGALGPPLDECLEKSVAIDPARFGDPKVVNDFAKSVVDYQRTRIAREFEADEDLKPFADQVPGLAAVFAPYFYVEPSQAAGWLTTNLSLMRAASSSTNDVPVHGVICADVSHLSDAAFRKRLVDEVPQSGVKGVWLWFSKFYEEEATDTQLQHFRALVADLSKTLEVHTMHGGFFSLALSKFGLTGVSHGVGYGEQKDVVPVIGQSTPTVRYYLPPIARRLGVPEIERAFDAMGVTTPQEFHEKVCDCVVCRGVVANAVSEFSAFGDKHRSRPTAKRDAQTPAAAKRCRFHFLLARIRERDVVRGGDVDSIVTKLEASASTWGVQPSLQVSCRHLERWAQALS